MFSMKSFLRARLAPFEQKQFRWFYSAQMMSLIGNWMQELARSWIVMSLVGRASAMGALLFAAAVPNLLFGFRAGDLADKRDIRGILMLTQIALATSAFALGVVVSSGHIQYWHLFVFALLEGTIIAFDFPAFSKITPRLVPKKDFQQALALNTFNFHLSRVIGPSLAGVIMGLWGPASVFWLNAFSFVGVVLVITRLQFQESQGGPLISHDEGGTREAWKYLKSDPVLSKIVTQQFLVVGLLFPLLFTTFRVYLTDRFGLSSKEFGYVFATPGLGALFGSMTFLLWNPKRPLSILPYSLAGVILFLSAMAFVQTLPMAIAGLMLFSFMLFLSLSSLNVTLQVRIEHKYRGRISAIVGMGFISLAPIMSAPVGVVSDLIGPRTLMFAIASVLAIGSLILRVRDMRPAVL